MDHADAVIGIAIIAQKKMVFLIIRTSTVTFRVMCEFAEGFIWSTIVEGLRSAEVCRHWLTSGANTLF
jgi:hypothetical protein